MELVQKIKYGDVAHSYQSPHFHVAGPVILSVGKIVDINDLVDPSLIGDYGEILPCNFKTNIDFYNAVKKLGEAYLEGKLSFNGLDQVPINSELFMLLVDKNELNNVIKEISGLEDITLKGEFKQPLERTTISDLLPALIDSKVMEEEGFTKKYQKTPKTENPLEKARHYIRDLLFWKLNCFDYSDHVSFAITEREKKGKGIKRKNFIIERNWSKANKGSGSSSYRVVDENSENIIISGVKK